MSEPTQCPKCGQEPHSPAYPHWRCGSQLVKGSLVQTEQCRICELEATVERLASPTKATELAEALEAAASKYARASHVGSLAIEASEILRRLSAENERLKAIRFVEPPYCAMCTPRVCKECAAKMEESCKQIERGEGIPVEDLIAKLQAEEVDAARLAGWEEAREACRSKVREKMAECAKKRVVKGDLERNYFGGGLAACNEVLDAIAALTPPTKEPT